jgi:5'-nucleotidase (lipoprotein e(P4) family)
MKPNRIKLFGLLLVVAVLSACSTKTDNGAEAVIEKQNKNEKLLYATLYQQTAAEKAALCFQAFNWAKRIVLDDTRRMGLSKAGAVVVDIDETILDNSPYEAESILANISYPERWDEWIGLADAKPLPGSVAFLNFAKENGYEVFYITNRKEKQRISTLENLEKFNFPNVDDQHLLMRTDGKSKDGRRKTVTEKYRIVLLMGDNMADFATVFDQKPLEERMKLVNDMKDRFGFEFIVLPNTMYGEWLNALHDYNFDLSDEEIEKMMLGKLKGF